jgi:hypothetical protein
MVSTASHEAVVRLVVESPETPPEGVDLVVLR